MNPQARHPALIFAAILLLTIVIGGLGFFLRSPAGSTEGAVALGVTSSLLASIVFAGITAMAIGNRGKVIDERLESLRRAVEALSTAVPLLAQAETEKVRAIKQKVAYSDEEWLAVLREAQGSLIMVGHALDKWCRSPKLEREFRKKVCEVLESGGEVLILVLDENAKKVPDLRRKEYAGRVHDTLEVLAELNQSLPEADKKRLRVNSLGDGREMHYMAVANDRFMITAPYPTTIQNSNPMPALTLDTESEIARELAADINALIADRATTPVDLDLFASANSGYISP